ncbi:hypothetical protein [Bifidobacterium tissieri]|uniref:hypothetical protein n=1 Tax=Bifidobacterium tissieri TaxID=1630162 RepID=UPI001303A812|nr:hypothetical protein [Bifidobacterium tissieri]
MSQITFFCCQRLPHFLTIVDNVATRGNNYDIDFPAFLCWKQHLHDEIALDERNFNEQ